MWMMFINTQLDKTIIIWLGGKVEVGDIDLRLMSHGAGWNNPKREDWEECRGSGKGG